MYNQDDGITYQTSVCVCGSHTDNILCVGYHRKPEYDTAIVNKPDKEAGNGLPSRENFC